ncbi:enediyne antibiotic chromoprotein [Nocardia sp. NPDC051570]|uniref:enediyne antibiotic chromoprotein n=1 Tax=Nocardia sp. NPDC051570 TaxID=3364324 RepID=UPI003790C4A1
MVPNHRFGTTMARFSAVHAPLRSYPHARIGDIGMGDLFSDHRDVLIGIDGGSNSMDRKVVRLFPKLLTVVVGSLAALTIGAPLAMAAPAVTATPSTGLSDGDVVAVTASGFPASTGVFAALCAMVDNETLCDQKAGVITQADGNGNVSTSLTVHAAFTGYDKSNQPKVNVDCKFVSGGCYVGVVDKGFTSVGEAPISFR